MMLSFMEGFRRAYRLPREDWSFWGRRMRALAACSNRPGPSLVSYPRRCLWAPDRGVDDCQCRPRVAPYCDPLLAHGAMVPGSDHEHCRFDRSVPLWNAPQRTLVMGSSRLHLQYGNLVSSHAAFWVVRHAHCGLFDVLRLIWRRYCYPGLAVHHCLQRSARRRAQRVHFIATAEPSSLPPANPI
jgi:hypothetical protein